MCIKGQTYAETINTPDINALFLLSENPSKVKVSKESSDLDQSELIDSYRKFYPMYTKHASFYSSLRTFSIIEHIIGHRVSPNKYKRVDIMPFIS